MKKALSRWPRRCWTAKPARWLCVSPLAGWVLRGWPRSPTTRSVTVERTALDLLEAVWMLAGGFVATDNAALVCAAFSSSAAQGR
ncbi:hypothetical protein [Streptomyces sp. CA-106131]|uniref:hypothetical protein n=1 Tax=Streptomyces sp. CA-106131 TaxID=3240045 RepID=UPI003D8DA54E